MSAQGDMIAEAGHAHVDRLLEELPQQECDILFSNAVRWNVTRAAVAAWRGRVA